MIPENKELSGIRVDILWNVYDPTWEEPSNHAIIALALSGRGFPECPSDDQANSEIEKMIDNYE